MCNVMCNVYDLSKYKNIILVGDIHGKFEDFINKIERLDLKETLIFQTGDFGAGFGGNSNTREGKYFLSMLNKIDNVLKERDCGLVVVRGNHDNPSYFCGLYNRSNIILASDYRCVKTYIGNILLIGGAISIDREIRTVSINYWPNEKVVRNNSEVELIVKKIEINYIISHTNPTFCYPSGNVPWYSDEINKDIYESRSILTDIYHIFKEHGLKKWINSHYHYSYKETINNVEFITLDIDEFQELK